MGETVGRVTARTDRLFDQIEAALSLAGRMIDHHEEQYDGEMAAERAIVGKALISLELLRNGSKDEERLKTFLYDEYEHCQAEYDRVMSEYLPLDPTDPRRAELKQEGDQIIGRSLCIGEITKRLNIGQFDIIREGMPLGR